MASSGGRKTRSGERNHKHIGCMSGIFQILHRHGHGRKRITQVGKTNSKSGSPEKPKETVRNSLPKTTSPVSYSGDAEKKRKIEIGVLGSPEKLGTADFRRLSCDIPRSPTLPLEMRRSTSMSWSPGTGFSPEKNSRSPGAVARLMGLGEIPVVALPESAAEKRRNIFLALERCDEDLRALRKIIEAVQITECRKKTAGVTAEPLVVKGAVTTAVKVRAGSGREESVAGNMSGRSSKRSAEFNSEEPSPDSVLDAWSYRGEILALKSGLSRLQNGNECKKFKDETLDDSFFTRRMEGFPGFSRRKNDNFNGNFLSSVRKINCRSPFSSSKAIIENVNDVCKEGMCEEIWENRKMGVVLEGDIFGELIEEIIWELSSCSNSFTLPFQACKRRLCF